MKVCPECGAPIPRITTPRDRPLIKPALASIGIGLIVTGFVAAASYGWRLASHGAGWSFHPIIWSMCGLMASFLYARAARARIDARMGKSDPLWGMQCGFLILLLGLPVHLVIQVLATGP